MGVVLKALDPALYRVVAIKLLAPELASSSRARDRFLREARAAAAVCHEHVVTIHAVDETDGAPYIVMQYVAGQSLQDQIDREGPLGLKVVLRVGMQVAAGLAAAHAQGLVHRDIKPANILLENGVERARITDFGLARAGSDARLTASGTLAGTPQYMAPEQARGEAVDHRTDLFSLGCVLYAMATGKAPFDAESAVAVLRKVSDEPHPPIQRLNPELPSWLTAVVDRLMAKIPAARYQSAAEVADLLAGHLAELKRQEQTVNSADHPGPEPSERRGTRLTRLVPVAAALTLMALLVPALMLVRTNRATPEPTAPAPVRPDEDVELAAGVKVNPHAESREGPPPAPADWLALGLASNARKDHAGAVRSLSMALRQNPGAAKALLARGDAYRYLKNYPAALADYTELIRVAPLDAEGYHARAFVLVELKEFDRAVADCDEALRLSPKFGWIYYHRGLAENGRKDWNRAVADFSRFLDRVPNFDPAYMARARSYQNQGDLVRALADMDRALELAPNNIGYYHYRGWLHARRGEYDQAIADYTRALRDQPDDPVRRADRACAWALAGRYDEAEADFAVALQGAGAYPWPLVRRARYLDHARGDYDRAVSACDRMIAVDPSFAEAYLTRGLARQARGDAAGAVNDLDRVLTLNQPDATTFEGRLANLYGELYRARGLAHAKLGQTAPAVTDLDRAIGLGRGDAAVFQARGDARAKLGDTAGAKGDHDRAAQLRANPSPDPASNPNPNPAPRPN
jgi:tetratricopeptide (TPR) repeat protein